MFRRFTAPFFVVVFCFLHNLSDLSGAVCTVAAGAHSGAKISQVEVEVVPASWQGIHPVNGIATYYCAEKNTHLPQMSADQCEY